MEREPWCSIYEICKYLNCTYYAVKGAIKYAFDKKHIPFSLIESGHFEPDEETFGEITMT